MKTSSNKSFQCHVAIHCIQHLTNVAIRCLQPLTRVTMSPLSRRSPINTTISFLPHDETFSIFLPQLNAIAFSVFLPLSISISSCGDEWIFCKFLISKLMSFSASRTHMNFWDLVNFFLDMDGKILNKSKQITLKLKEKVTRNKNKNKKIIKMSKNEDSQFFNWDGCRLWWMFFGFDVSKEEY